MQQQRHLPALRAHITQLLSSGWTIVSREPLQLKCEARRCYVQHGMLISYH